MNRLGEGPAGSKLFLFRQYSDWISSKIFALPVYFLRTTLMEGVIPYESIYLTVEKKFY